MFKSEFNRQFNAFLKENGLEYTPKVAVEFNDGKILYLNEAEVRFLQIKAKQAAEISKEAFDKFCSEVTVYSGPHKTHSHKMHFRTNGRFSDDFDANFYNLNSELALRLFE